MEARSHKLIIFIGITLLLYGCSTTMETVESFSASTPPEGKSIVYFYNSYSKGWMGGQIKILHNDASGLYLSAGGYTEYTIYPGKHEFKTVTALADIPVTIKIKEGDVGYVRLDYKQHPVWLHKNKWVLMRVFPEQAVEEIKFCRKE